MEGLPLVGYLEIAQRAGVQRNVVTMWRSRDLGFPKPVAELRIGPIWWWPDVKGWLESTGREFDADIPLENVRPSGMGNFPRLPKKD
jgi:hypothetical protein